MTAPKLRRDLDAAQHLHSDSTSADIAQWARESEGLGHFAGLRDGDLVDETLPYDDREPLGRRVARSLFCWAVFMACVAVATLGLSVIAG